MLKQTVSAAALAAVLAAPALAQQPMKTDQPANSAVSDPGKSGNVNFLKQESANDWRASKLIGTDVYGPDGKSIGSVNDVVIADNGQIKGVVVGVGGFLGVGEKNVALPFAALNIARKASSGAIAKITVSYTKDELMRAPKFAYFQAAKSETGGSSVADDFKAINDMSNSKMQK
jgi:sporulation protein YlmC with PRC-barrel domain